MYKYLLVLFLLTGCTLGVMAQNPDTASTTKVKIKTKDTLISTRSDTAAAESFAPKNKKPKDKIYHPDSLHSPHTAIMHSLIIPGWGQIYNHRWWKVPLIYAGLASFVYYYTVNESDYKVYLALAKYYEKGVVPGPKDPYYAQYKLYEGAGVTAIDDAEAGSKRNVDLCVFGIIGVWGINIVDAYIDSKFIHSYTVDSNLSMRIAPGMLSQPGYAQNPILSYIPGLKITFTLR
jgi:hypothetical protein